jgi:outer membrane protein assembly factor BamB
MAHMCSFDLQEPVFVAPALVSSTSSSFIFVCCTVKGLISALKVSIVSNSIEEVWRFRCSGPLYASATVLEDAIVVLPAFLPLNSDGSQSWHIFAFDAFSGTRIAAEPLLGISRIATSIAIDSSSSICAVVSVAGSVQVWKWTKTSMAEERIRFSKIASFQLSAEVYSSPIWSSSSDDLVLVCGCRDDHLHAFTLQFP